MSNTRIILDKEYFTVETSKAFLHELESACKTMDSELFAKLFIKYYYEISSIKDYKEVLDTISTHVYSWNDWKKETELLNVEQFDSKCLFCKIGKTVKVYKWTYRHNAVSKNIVYSQTIAFYFELEEGRLIEFGVCNGHLDKEEMDNLNNF